LGPTVPADGLATILARLVSAAIDHVAVSELTTLGEHLPVVRVFCPDLAFLPWAARTAGSLRRLLEAPSHMGLVPGHDYELAAGKATTPFLA